MGYLNNILKSIFRGTTANDETGTPARDAGKIINDNIQAIDNALEEIDEAAFKKENVVTNLDDPNDQDVPTTKAVVDQIGAFEDLTFEVSNKLNKGNYDGDAGLLNQRIIDLENTAPGSMSDTEIASAYHRVANEFTNEERQKLAELENFRDPNVDHRYLNITQLLANQNEQSEDDLIKVLDASDDPDIESGEAFYYYEGTTAGTLEDYNLLTNAEVETLETEVVAEMIKAATLVKLDEDKTFRVGPTREYLTLKDAMVDVLNYYPNADYKITIIADAGINISEAISFIGMNFSHVILSTTGIITATGDGLIFSKCIAPTFNAFVLDQPGAITNSRGLQFYQCTNLIMDAASKITGFDICFNAEQSTGILIYNDCEFRPTFGGLGRGIRFLNCVARLRDVILYLEEYATSGQVSFGISASGSSNIQLQSINIDGDFDEGIICDGSQVTLADAATSVLKNGVNDPSNIIVRNGGIISLGANVDADIQTNVTVNAVHPEGIIFDNRTGSGGGAEPDPDPIGEPSGNLLLLVGGQSNAGTDPNTGRVAYADRPEYLQTAPDNVRWVEVVNSAFQLNPWTVDPTLQWGWLDQALHIVAPQYQNVIYAKRGLGGTFLTVTKDGTAEYPRDDFKNKASWAIGQADAEWGAGNYDVVVLWNQGESNGIDQPVADQYQQALTEWFSEIRSQVLPGAKIIFNKIGEYQDVAFPFLIPNVWEAQEAVAALSEDNILITGLSDTKWGLADLTDDISHYNAEGAISLGTNFADAALSVLGKSKVDSTAPVLVSIVVEAAAPNQIVLTYDKTLNEALTPFWYEFVLSDGRKVNSVSITGTKVSLTVSENYYTGISGTITYNRSQVFEANIQDLAGNVADAFADQAITNNSALPVPTFTPIYASNFTAGVDGWAGTSGGAVSVVDGIDGEDNVLKIDITDSTPLIYRANTFPAVVGENYKVRFRINIPEEYYGTDAVNTYVRLLAGTSLPILFTDVYLRRMALDNQWVEIEFPYTSTADNNTQMRFQGTNATINSSFYVKDIVVTKIS